MDVIYDHFLALDENEFTDESLKAFTINTYAMLDQFTDIFRKNSAKCILI